MKHAGIAGLSLRDIGDEVVAKASFLLRLRPFNESPVAVGTPPSARPAFGGRSTSSPATVATPPSSGSKWGMLRRQVSAGSLLPAVPPSAPTSTGSMGSRARMQLTESLRQWRAKQRDRMEDDAYDEPHSDSVDESVRAFVQSQVPLSALGTTLARREERASHREQGLTLLHRLLTITSSHADDSTAAATGPILTTMNTSVLQALVAACNDLGKDATAFGSTVAATNASATNSGDNGTDDGDEDEDSPLLGAYILDNLEACRPEQVMRVRLSFYHVLRTVVRVLRRYQAGAGVGNPASRRQAVTALSTLLMQFRADDAQFLSRSGLLDTVVALAQQQDAAADRVQPATTMAASVFTYLALSVLHFRSYVPTEPRYGTTSNLSSYGRHKSAFAVEAAAQLASTPSTGRSTRTNVLAQLDSRIMQYLGEPDTAQQHDHAVEALTLLLTAQQSADADHAAKIHTKQRARMLALAVSTGSPAVARIAATALTASLATFTARDAVFALQPFTSVKVKELSGAVSGMLLAAGRMLHNLTPTPKAAVALRMPRVGAAAAATTVRQDMACNIVQVVVAMLEMPALESAVAGVMRESLPPLVVSAVHLLNGAPIAALLVRHLLPPLHVGAASMAALAGHHQSRVRPGRVLTWRRGGDGLAVALPVIVVTTDIVNSTAVVLPVRALSQDGAVVAALTTVPQEELDHDPVSPQVAALAQEAIPLLQGLIPARTVQLRGIEHVLAVWLQAMAMGVTHSIAAGDTGIDWKGLLGVATQTLPAGSPTELLRQCDVHLASLGAVWQERLARATEAIELVDMNQLHGAMQLQDGQLVMPSNGTGMAVSPKPQLVVGGFEASFTVEVSGSSSSSGAVVALVMYPTSGAAAADDAGEHACLALGVDLARYTAVCEWRPTQGGADTTSGDAVSALSGATSVTVHMKYALGQLTMDVAAGGGEAHTALHHSLDLSLAPAALQGGMAVCGVRAVAGTAQLSITDLSVWPSKPDTHAPSDVPAALTALTTMDHTGQLPAQPLQEAGAASTQPTPRPEDQAPVLPLPLLLVSVDTPWLIHDIADPQFVLQAHSEQLGVAFAKDEFTVHMVFRVDSGPSMIKQVEIKTHSDWTGPVQTGLVFVSDTLPSALAVAGYDSMSADDYAAYKTARSRSSGSTQAAAGPAGRFDLRGERSAVATLDFPQVGEFVLLTLQSTLPGQDNIDLTHVAILGSPLGEEALRALPAPEPITGVRWVRSRQRGSPAGGAMATGTKGKLITATAATYSAASGQPTWLAGAWHRKASATAAGAGAGAGAAGGGDGDGTNSEATTGVFLALQAAEDRKTLQELAGSGATGAVPVMGTIQWLAQAGSESASIVWDESCLGSNILVSEGGMRVTRLVSSGYGTQVSTPLSSSPMEISLKVTNTSNHLYIGVVDEQWARSSESESMSNQRRAWCMQADNYLYGNNSTVGHATTTISRDSVMDVGT